MDDTPFIPLSGSSQTFSPIVFFDLDHDNDVDGRDLLIFTELVTSCDTCLPIFYFPVQFGWQSNTQLPAGDLDHDSDVDGLDLTIYADLYLWGKTSLFTSEMASLLGERVGMVYHPDMDRDGDVDGLDFARYTLLRSRRIAAFPGGFSARFGR